MATKKDVEYFRKTFEKQIKVNKRHARSNIGYGEDVMPVLKKYHGLSNFEEMNAFREALQNLLASSDSEKHNFGLDVCMGFFIFRDVIGHK